MRIKVFLNIAVLFLLLNCVYAQENPQINSYKLQSPENITESYLPYSIAFAAVLYLLNPILLIDNHKINLGINKEFSVGFGNFGEHRISFDYAYIFRSNNSQQFRLGYKYDYLLKNLKPSNTFQSTSAITLGLSYFTDFTRSGISPEIGFGYSIRNHKMLIFPHVKFRYTSVVNDKFNSLYDFSFGVMVGIANPFIDKKIRREGF